MRGLQQKAALEHVTRGSAEAPMLAVTAHHPQRAAQGELVLETARAAQALDKIAPLARDAMARRRLVHSLVAVHDAIRFQSTAEISFLLPVYYI